MATKQITPSKDALRVLRQLALHSSPSITCTRFSSLDHADREATCRSGPALPPRRHLHTNSSGRNNRRSHRALQAHDAFSRAPRTYGYTNRLESRRRQTSAALLLQAKPNANSEIGSEQQPEVTQRVTLERDCNAQRFRTTSSTASTNRVRQHPDEKKRYHARTTLSTTQATPNTTESEANHVTRTYNSGKDPDAAAAHQLRQTLHAHASTGSPEDWRLVRRRFFAACSHMPAAVTRPVRDELVENLLQESPPRLEAVELLCKNPKQNAEHSHQELQKYLTYFCAKHADETLQIMEARKLFQGMRLCSTPLEAEVLRPVVQTAVEKGKPEFAHELLTTLSAEMNFSLSLPMMTDVIRGYGRQGSWTRIDELVTWLHNQGISRQKPRGFAAVIRHAFNLYANYNPSTEETYDFLTYCIQSCGMVPTAKLSSDVLKLCVRRRRYDILHRWMKDRQTYFPGLVNPAREPSTALEIATAWASDSTHHVSSLEVLATCKPLARGAVRSPFSDELRYVAKEVIETDITKRCLKLCIAVKSDPLLDKLPVPKNFKGFGDLHEYASGIISCSYSSESLQDARSPSSLSPKRNARILLLRAELMRQLSAAYETHLLLHDFDAYLKIFGPVVSDNHVQVQPESTTEAQTNKMISTFYEQWRYQSQTSTEIVDHINTVYQHLETRDGSTPRTVFFTAFVALTNIERYRSVLALLRALYISKWSERIFNRQFLSLWVRTAMTVSNPVALREALWAVVDSPPSIELPARFLVLVRLAHADIKYFNSIGWRRMSQHQHDEIEYLKKRIYRRKWYQMGCPNAEDIEEVNLREWAREMLHQNVEPMEERSASSTEEHTRSEPAKSVHRILTPSQDALLTDDHNSQAPTESQVKTVSDIVPENHTLLRSVDSTVDQPLPHLDVVPSIAEQANRLAEADTAAELVESTIRQPLASWDDMPSIDGQTAAVAEADSLTRPAESGMHQPFAPWEVMPSIGNEAAALTQGYFVNKTAQGNIPQPFAPWDDMPPIGDQNSQPPTDSQADKITHQPLTSLQYETPTEDHNPEPTKDSPSRTLRSHGRKRPRIKIRRPYSDGREMRKINNRPSPYVRKFKIPM